MEMHLVAWPLQADHSKVSCEDVRATDLELERLTFPNICNIYTNHALQMLTFTWFMIFALNLSV